MQGTGRGVFVACNKVKDRSSYNGEYRLEHMVPEAQVPQDSPVGLVDHCIRVDLADLTDQGTQAVLDNQEVQQDLAVRHNIVEYTLEHTTVDMEHDRVEVGVVGEVAVRVAVCSMIWYTLERRMTGNHRRTCWAIV